MNDLPAPIALARKVLSHPPPPGAKTRVFRALRSKERGASKGTLRTATLVFAMLVSASAAAIGTSAVARWIDGVRSESTVRATEPTRQAAAPAVPRERAVPALTAVPGPDLPLATPSEEAPAQPAATAHAATPEAPRPVVVAETEESALAQQVAAYREAVGLLDLSPGLAIVRLRAFEDRWPMSPLREEASLRQVQALMSLGRQADARVQAQAFLKRYPRSAKRADMQAIVGDPAGE